jgi:anti-sigma-K factor RskA
MSVSSIFCFKILSVEEATFVGTPTFWVIIVSAVAALVVVIILIVALVNMKQRNDEIVAAVTRLDNQDMTVKPFGIQDGVDGDD